MESPNWTAYNAAQTEEKTRFVALLSDLCSTIPQPKQAGKGRPRLPLSDMVFASVYKVYVGFSSRRFTSDLRDAFVDGHVNSTPHFNSVSRYLSDPGPYGRAQRPHHGQQLALEGDRGRLCG